MAWPSTLSSFTDPTPTQRLNSPSHSSIESAQNTALEEIQAFVGTSSSTLGTLYYDIRAAASNGGGHVQSANKGGTGQTSYTKGDIIVAQSSSVLSKLAVGTDGYIFVADSGQNAGVRWTAPTASSLGIANPVVRVYTATSIAGWTKPSLLNYVTVELAGGGGGGGYASNPASGEGGGGGGAGGYAKKFFIPASALSASVTIVVAAGGNGQQGTGGTGSVGGTSAFGSIVTASGGGGGVFQSGGGAGGVGAGGDINLTGGVGCAGFAGTVYGNNSGGSNPLGMGGSDVYQFGSRAGNLYGGGGSGGKGSSGSGTSSGGNGAAGVVIVSEYFA